MEGSIIRVEGRPSRPALACDGDRGNEGVRFFFFFGFGPSRNRRARASPSPSLSFLTNPPTKNFPPNQRYFGTAVGKGRQAAKTEIERLNLKELKCEQALVEVAKM